MVAPVVANEQLVPQPIDDGTLAVVWCGMVWCGVVWCGAVRCGMEWCDEVWCGAVRCGVLNCGVVWSCIRNSVVSIQDKVFGTFKVAPYRSSHRFCVYLQGKPERLTFVELHTGIPAEAVPL